MKRVVMFLGASPLSTGIPTILDYCLMLWLGHWKRFYVVRRFRLWRTRSVPTNYVTVERPLTPRIVAITAKTRSVRMFQRSSATADIRAALESKKIWIIKGCRHRQPFLFRLPLPVFYAC